MYKEFRDFRLYEYSEFLSALSVYTVIFFILYVNWWIITDVFRIVVRLKRRQLCKRQQNITSGKTNLNHVDHSGFFLQNPLIGTTAVISSWLQSKTFVHYFSNSKCNRKSHSLRTEKHAAKYCKYLLGNIYYNFYSTSQWLDNLNDDV
jgi:hypothetical protein